MFHFERERRYLLAAEAPVIGPQQNCQIILILVSLIFLLRKKYQNQYQKSILTKQVLVMKGSTGILPQPLGLPNVRNSCFLNSVLQQLYQIVPIHQAISAHSEVLQADIRGSVLLQLNKVFQYMKTGKQWKLDNAIILKQLLSTLGKELLDYSYGKQYDAFQTLLNILNHLFQYDHALQKYFTLEYSLKCSCEGFSIQDIAISATLNACALCKDKFQRQIICFPEYLIVKGQTDDKAFQYLLQCQLYCYRLQSTNAYIGNGQSGHYYSICNYNGQLYQYNDQFVRKVQHNIQNEMFSIYRRINRQPEAKKTCLPNAHKMLENSNVKIIGCVISAFVCLPPLIDLVILIIRQW